MDDDLDRMTPAELAAEVKKLRRRLRAPDISAPATNRILMPPQGWRVEAGWGFCGGCVPAPPAISRDSDFASPPRPIVFLRAERRA